MSHLTQNSACFLQVLYGVVVHVRTKSCSQICSYNYLKDELLTMRSKDFCSFAWICWFLLIQTVFGFYLPGLAPVSYCDKSTTDGKCKVGRDTF